VGASGKTIEREALRSRSLQRRNEQSVGSKSGNSGFKLCLELVHRIHSPLDQMAPLVSRQFGDRPVEILRPFNSGGLFLLKSSIGDLFLGSCWIQSAYFARHYCLHWNVQQSHRSLFQQSGHL